MAAGGPALYRAVHMLGTSLIYSSHDRSNHIHNDLIAQRALRGKDNQRLLFLPMSEGVQNGSEMERQDFSWGRFEWFFRYYEGVGLEAYPFYWRSTLREEDVEKLWYHLYNDEVVILGGGSPKTGLARYKELGARFANEPGKFGRLLHERRARGLLTVGFSAGADQLCERLFRDVHHEPGDNQAFGLVRNTLCTLHHESSRNGDLQYAAHRFPQFRVFGLPNDSGLNSDWGVLPSGNIWQVIEFIVDRSWTDEEDQWHVKTRWGAKIDHIFPDGRHWAFDDGDHLIRISSPDGRFDESWYTRGGGLFHYDSQQPSHFGSIEELLGAH